MSLQDLPPDLIAKLLDTIDVVDPCDAFFAFEHPQAERVRPPSICEDPFCLEEPFRVPRKGNVLLPLRELCKIFQSAVDRSITAISISMWRCARMLVEEATKFDVINPSGLLPRRLRQMPHLAHMNLNLKTLPLPDVAAILSTFAASCPTLRRLRLEFDERRDASQEGSQLCLDALRSFTSLQALGIEGTLNLTQGEAEFPALPSLHFLKLCAIDKLQFAPAPNLRELIISGLLWPWKIKDPINLKHLPSCQSLERLHLCELHVVDLQLPQSIKNLRLTNLSLNPGLDFTSMALPLLEHLYLVEIEFKQRLNKDSLVALLQRVQLRSLTLINYLSVGITDFTMQTRMESLVLEDIRYGFPLSPPTSLATLQLHNLRISALNCGDLSSLRNLRISECHLDVVSDIEALSSLQSLKLLISDGVDTIAPLQGLTELELSTKDNSENILAPLPDFAHFSALCNLKLIDLPCCPSGSVKLPPLLKVLHINNFDYDIKELPIHGLKHLQTLTLYKLRLVGTLEVVQLEALQELNVGGLGDMIAVRLSGLKRLRKLHVQACKRLEEVVMHEDTVALERLALVACNCLSLVDVSEKLGYELVVEDCPMLDTAPFAGEGSPSC